MFSDANSDMTPLTDALKEISKLKGIVDIEMDGRQEYDVWYNGIDYSNISGDTGVIERIHWGVLKLALILALSQDYDMVVKKRHVEEAIDLCTGILKNYEVLAMGTGKSMSADAAAIFLAFLWEKGGSATRKDVLRMNWSHFDVVTLDGSLIPTLEGAGLIKTLGVDNEVGYELTDRGKKAFTGE